MNKTNNNRAGIGIIILAASALLVAVPIAEGAESPSRDPATPDGGESSSELSIEELQARAIGSDRHLVMLSDEVASRQGDLTVDERVAQATGSDRHLVMLNDEVARRSASMGAGGARSCAPRRTVYCPV